MPHFDIPLDLPHAGRIADRILTLLERHTQENAIEAPEMLETAEQLAGYLFRFSATDENPAAAEAAVAREEAAVLGHQLVDQMIGAGIRGDRLGQLVRNFFECLELGAEGAEISLRAGENPNSLQRPV
jgi:hypothetical protein